MYPGGRMIWTATAWLIAVGVGATVVWTLFILLNGLGGPAASNQSPEKILKKRLTDGEIDVDEYRKRLAALSKNKHAAEATH
jgi:uncharacterized membrane protein